MSYPSKRQFLPDVSFKPSKTKKMPWWQQKVIYQIYPRSFYDTTNNGTGDLKGIIKKADYIQNLGVGAIWLSPIYESPMADFGYDVSNYLQIDPIFGTMQDFDELIQEMHKRDIKVIMDFIPNHTSDEHKWFQKSCQREEPYTDYYIWKAPNEFDTFGVPLPPNNWLSVFGGSAWTWNEERQEFYYHQFLDKQPDLNYRNKNVVLEMENVLRFWLDKGVDGFRIDAIKHLFESEDLDQDEPLSGRSDITDPFQYEYLNHTLTVNRPETFKILKRWRQILDQYLERLLMVEVCDGDIHEVMKYYGDETTGENLSDFPFNFSFITNLTKRTELTGYLIKSTIDLWMDNMPQDRWPNWVLGNHDNDRLAHRLGEDMVDGMHMITLLLPGTPITYYGEEIGMTNTDVPYEKTQDPFGLKFGYERFEEFSRDPARTPMQWNNKPFSGFTKGVETWLPINKNFKELNVEINERSNESHLKLYKQLIQLRKEKAFLHGNLTFPLINSRIFSFIRRHGNHDQYLIIVNVSTETVNVNMKAKASKDTVIPKTGTIIARSSEDARIETKPGARLDLANINLHGGEGLVIKLNVEVSFEKPLPQMTNSHQQEEIYLS